MITAITISWGLLAIGPNGYGDELFFATLRTLEISALAYMIGLILGLAGALGKMAGGKAMRCAVNCYTLVFRALPELLLILLLFYAGTDGLNALLNRLEWGPININGLAVAIIVLGVVQGAYATEVLRGAIQSIPRGEVDAARACGMSPALRLRRIIVPAMLPLAMPGLSNLWLNVTKESALIALVGFSELAKTAQQAASGTKQYFLFFMIAALIYFSISYLSTVAFKQVGLHLQPASRFKGQP